jgi:hypothetical protein
MKQLRILLAFIPTAFGMQAAEPTLPVGSGTYQFLHKDAEMPSIAGFAVTVRISGRRYEVLVAKRGDPSVQCPLYDGTLMWNQNVRKWVLGNRESDRTALDAGGCGDGPDVIDFEEKIIWTCSGGTIATAACEHAGL